MWLTSRGGMLMSSCSVIDNDFACAREGHAPASPSYHAQRRSWGLDAGADQAGDTEVQFKGWQAGSPCFCGRRPRLSRYFRTNAPDGWRQKQDGAWRCARTPPSRQPRRAPQATIEVRAHGVLSPVCATAIRQHSCTCRRSGMTVLDCFSKRNSRHRRKKT